MKFIMKIYVICILIFLCNAAIGQNPVFYKSDAVIYSDTNQIGVLDVGDTVKFTITLQNVLTVPILADVIDQLPVGLAGLHLLSYPESIIYNPNPIGNINFNFDSYGTSGPVQPLPNMTAKCVSSNSSFNGSGFYAGVLSGLNTSVSPNQRYYGFCTELNQSISLGTHSMAFWDSPIGAIIQDGKPPVNGQPISIQQKLMIQGIFHCLNVDNSQALTSSSAQDLVVAHQSLGIALKNLTNYQAAAAQIAILEIVHETWNGPGSVSLTSGLMTWQIRVSGIYQLPADFVTTFNNLVSCAATYMEMMSEVCGNCESTADTLKVKNINVQPNASTQIEFTAIITKDAINGNKIINTACLDLTGDGIGELCDSGETGVITNTEQPPELQDFCETTFIINKEAGTKAGYSGDGGSALNAKLYYPTQAALDKDNNLYVADYSNHVVRKIDTAGNITTFAGTPQVRGYSGDGGLATLAKLYLPSDVFVRGHYLYISELGNCIIRKVDLLTNIISTVAGTGAEGYSGNGGLATAATLYRPRGVYVDVNGDIYIADTFNFCIRKVDACTGIITTIAGTGVAGHADDGDIAIDTPLEWIHDITMRSDGVLYFSEQNGYNLVRRIVNGKIETVAGKAGSSEVGDCMLAVDSYLKKPYGIAFDSFDNLYIADEQNHKIRKIDAATGFITTIAGTGVAGDSGEGFIAIEGMLNTPTGVVVGSDNVLHICDRFNHKIKKINLMDKHKKSYFPDVQIGYIDTLAGTGIAGYNGDATVATNCKLNYPGGITNNSAGEIIFADRSNHRLRVVNLNASVITLAGIGPTRGFSGDGGQATLAKINFPNDAAIDAAGNIYIVDQYNYVIRKIGTDGIITTIAGTPGVAGFSGDGDLAIFCQFNEPDSIAIYDNKIYISDKNNNRLRMIDLSTNVITTVAGNGAAGKGANNVNPLSTPLYAPRGIAISPSGVIYIAASGSHQIRKIEAGLITSIAGDGVAGYTGDGGLAIAARVYAPADVALGADGSVYIADYRNHVIRKIDTGGIISTVAGNGTAGYSGDKGPATSAQLNYPVGVVINIDGNLIISDRNNSVIRIVGQ